ncbi:MAG: hypothetical protein DI586_07790 [Micavibrio aeruginosavorus]|uniref:Uncharacterized protein n=1 Tax=Micavibrio aeruginosavorus TaxID=349221 RepID=A0A2W5FMW2_9BACT|nr:MAG: hypothetical protein DI586_07790 [Micavibrio aeruginosavorus]
MITKHDNHGVHSSHDHSHLKIDSSSFDIGQKALAELVLFKAIEHKDDPARIHGIHGPYEELTIRKTGKLPADYFAGSDPEPWGLRIRESRSNILWQVLSGVMDKHAEFGMNYMALTLDNSLSDEDYAKELGRLNKDWGDFLDHSGVFRDHHHTAMGHEYKRVACPACSTLTALACQDAGMQALFRELLPLDTADRRKLLSEKGLMPLLDKMIPDVKPQTKLEI